MNYTRRQVIRASTWCAITWPWSVLHFLAWRAWRNLVNPRTIRQAYREGLKLTWCQKHPPSPDYHWACEDYAGRGERQGVSGNCRTGCAGP